jgi:hypothetical protein
MPGGRPTKRTDDRQAIIVEALTKGYTRKAAASAAGMTYDTLREWEKADSEFSDAIQKAEGVAQGRLIDKIAAAKSWQAQAWIAERRWPGEFGQRQHVEMTGKDGGPIDHRDVSAIPDHERQALAAAIRDHLRSRDRGRREAATAADRET